MNKLTDDISDRWYFFILCRNRKFLEIEFELWKFKIPGNTTINRQRINRICIYCSFWFRQELKWCLWECAHLKDKYKSFTIRVMQLEPVSTSSCWIRMNKLFLNLNFICKKAINSLSLCIVDHFNCPCSFSHKFPNYAISTDLSFLDFSRTKSPLSSAKSDSGI